MKLITVTEAAKKLGVSRQVIENWGKEGVVDIKKVSKSKNSSWVDKKAIDIIGAKMVDIEHSKTMLNKEYEKQQELLKQEKEVTDDLRRALSLIRISGGICLHKDFYLAIPKMLEEVGVLVPREAQIMREIIGGEDTGCVAKRYGLTRSRVLQIFSNGCRKAAALNGIREIIDNEAFLKTEVERLNNELADLRKFANSAVQELKKYKEIQTNGITDAQIEEIDETLKLLNTPIKEYDHKLSIRTQNCLKAADVETIGGLVQYNKTDILKFRNFGKKSLIEIEDFVRELGLEFGTDIEKLKKERIMMYVSNDSEC